MFPPVDESILQNNPDFAQLYSNLTKVVLNPDGSSRQDPSAKELKQVQNELNKHRIRAAKQHLLTRALETVSPPDQPKTRPERAGAPRQQKPQLPEPLLDLLLALPALLDHANTLPPESVDLLLTSPPLSDLEEYLPDLAPLLSSSLRSSALDLTRIFHPSTNPSYLHRHIPSLAQSLSTLISREYEARRELTTARAGVLRSLVSLLDDYNTVVTSLLRCLEAKHGAVARSVELDATSVSLQAQRLEVDVQSAHLSLRREIYSPEAVAALQSYLIHLKDARTRAEERLKGLTAELGEYGVGAEGGEGKERMMREMARVYREMARQMEDTKVDLDRLQRS